MLSDEKHFCSGCHNMVVYLFSTGKCSKCTNKNGLLAQTGERLLYTQEVLGSIPRQSTITKEEI